MNLAELLKRLKLSGSSEIKDIVLYFRDGKVSAYNTSPDKTTASMVENYKTDVKVNATIGVPSISILEKYLKEFGENFKVEENKLIFEKGSKKVSLSLIETSAVDSAVPKEKFKEWIDVVKGNEVKKLVLSSDKIKEIVNDAKIIKATDIKIKFGNKISIILSDVDGSNIIEHTIEEGYKGEAIEIDFPPTLLDVLNSLVETSTFHIALEKPLLIESGRITYLVAPRTV